MALSRERIADELLKLLGLPDPVATLRLMIARNILRPVLPEIEDAERLAALVSAEKSAGVGGDSIRRLAALLPSDPEIAASVSARLRLSKRQSKRLVSAAETALEEPEMLAYRIGAEEAVDRLLLHRPSTDLDPLLAWQRPHLPIRGGDLIGLGLAPGPVVARTLQAIEREWARSGFPKDRETVLAIARRHVDQALRDSQ
jgi:poly(A) polymerase